MAGQRLNRASNRAQNFAKSIIDQAEVHADPLLTQEISIGPHFVQLSFTSAGCLTDLITGAFIKTPSREKQLMDAEATRVYVCQDGDGVVLPNLEWAHEWIIGGSVIPNLLTAPFRVFIDKNQGIIYCFDPEENRAAIFLRSTRELDLRSFITPFRLLWSWIAIGSSSLVLHAASVSINGSGILLSGPSGSGKSTLALTTGLSKGHSIVADDCVLVHGTDVHAIYSRVKIESGNLEKIGIARGVKVHEVPDAPNAKSYVQVDEDFSGFMPLIHASVLVFPAIYERGGYYELSKKRSVSMLTSDSMRELFNGTPIARRGIESLVSKLPSYRLLLEDSFQANVEKLEALVTHVTN